MKSVAKYCSLVSLAFVGIACADIGEDASPESTATNESNLKPAALPYGVPVPEGRSINAPPEPYTPSKHGAPTPDSAPRARNLADDPAIPHDFAKRRKGGNPREPLPPPGTGDRGSSSVRRGGRVSMLATTCRTISLSRTARAPIRLFMRPLISRRVVPASRL